LRTALAGSGGGSGGGGGGGGGGGIGLADLASVDSALPPHVMLQCMGVDANGAPLDADAVAAAAAAAATAAATAVIPSAADDSVGAVVDGDGNVESSTKTSTAIVTSVPGAEQTVVVAPVDVTVTADVMNVNPPPLKKKKVKKRRKNDVLHAIRAAVAAHIRHVAPHLAVDAVEAAPLLAVDAVEADDVVVAAAVDDTSSSSSSTTTEAVDIETVSSSSLPPTLARLRLILIDEASSLQRRLAHRHVWLLLYRMCKVGSITHVASVNLACLDFATKHTIQRTLASVYHFFPCFAFATKR
jgi:hypothetical protein